MIQTVSNLKKKVRTHPNGVLVLPYNDKGYSYKFDDWEMPVSMRVRDWCVRNRVLSLIKNDEENKQYIYKVNI